MGPHLLLTPHFPPARGGLARWMGDLARCWPPGALVVSTAAAPRAAAADAELPVHVDRLALPPARLRTVAGIVQWSRRAAMLAREHRAGFAWCEGVRPAGYPARWTSERIGTPYGILLHAEGLVRLRHRVRRSRLRRRAVRALVRHAAVLVADGRPTREHALALLGELGLPAADDPVRVVPLAGARGAGWDRVVADLIGIAQEFRGAAAVPGDFGDD
ncbi:MAG TPA: hypothetical protein VFS40_10655 [Gemmatimonadales bacterium]|nr:hypothetical protein [Gemmatimonadales bacterium]